MTMEKYSEWQSPCGPPGDHFLNQLATGGYFKTTDGEPSGNPSKLNESSSDKIKLHVIVNVINIQSIDLASETFTCRLRLYLMWSLSPKQQAAPLFQKHQQKAIEAGHYYSLTDSEVEEFCSAVTIPAVKFFNATEIEELDSIPGVRIYGGKEGAVLWNCGYIAKFKEYFPLQMFPFDHQELTLNLGQDDSRTWDAFDLTICQVQFHSKALELPEWKMFEPTIERSAISHKATTVTLQVKREPAFFINNIVAIMTMLSILSLVVFALPPDDLNDRVSVILTLLLTAVAFKLVITDSIPKVGYSTLIDNFVLGNMIFLFSTVILCTLGFLIEESFAQIADGCGLSPICHIGIVFQDVVTNYDTSVNLIIFAFSMSLFGLINAYWLYTVWRRERIHQHLNPLQKQPNRNWYSCSFSNPHFLPEPQKYPPT